MHGTNNSKWILWIRRNMRTIGCRLICKTFKRLFKRISHWKCELSQWSRVRSHWLQISISASKPRLLILPNFYARMPMIRTCPLHDSNRDLLAQEARPYPFSHLWKSLGALYCISPVGKYIYLRCTADLFVTVGGMKRESKNMTVDCGGWISLRL